MIVVHRNQIQNTIVSNLISAGVIGQDEAEHYYELLSALPLQELLSTLVVSHELRENCPDAINYYPIGEISVN